MAAAQMVVLTGRGVLTEVGPLIEKGPLGMPPALVRPYPRPRRPAGHIRTWATAFPSGYLVPRGV